MNKQEPTNKELLEMIAILSELTLQIVTENRTYWNNFKNPPRNKGGNVGTSRQTRRDK